MTTRKRQYRGKSSEDRRAHRREQFVTAGSLVFGDVGFHAATVKQLCKAAGLTERYFYESFKSREELFAACYDLQLDGLMENIVAALLHAPRTPSALAEAGLKEFFKQIQEDHLKARILMVEIYGVRYDQDRLFRRSIGRFSSLVEKIGLAQGVNSPADQFDAELLATGLVGVCIQMAQRWIVDGFQQPSERLVANCMLIFEGLMDRLTAQKSEASQKQ